MEDKAKWTKEISELLKTDERSGVQDIEYSYEVNSKGWKKEIVTITYVGGGKRKIDVFGNSLGSIYLEIGREVYDIGAIGRIHDEY